MRIALVDDDEFQLKLIHKMVSLELTSQGHGNHAITTYTTGEDFLNAWKPNEFDLIILDILMQGLTGVEVAYKIREKDEHVRIAFCTSSNEFASESYEVDAQHYLLKPITRDSIAKMFKRLNLESMEQARIVSLPDGHPVILRHILYTEYSNHAVTFYIKNEKPYRLRISQTETEALLFPHGFFISPYKGITVNLYAVDTLADDTLVLCDGTKLTVTRRKLKEVTDAYKAFRLKQNKKEL